MKYLVKVYYNEGYMRNDETIWNELWSKIFNSKEEAENYIKGRKEQFVEKYVMYYKNENDSKWTLIFDERKTIKIYE